jgi:hypothetical protein
MDCLYTMVSSAPTADVLDCKHCISLHHEHVFHGVVWSIATNSCSVGCCLSCSARRESHADEAHYTCNRKSTSSCMHKCILFAPVIPGYAIRPSVACCPCQPLSQQFGVPVPLYRHKVGAPAHVMSALLLWVLVGCMRWWPKADKPHALIKALLAHTTALIGDWGMP